MSARTRHKMPAQDLAIILIEECVDAQQVNPLRENLTPIEMQRFAATARRYQLAGVLLALSSASQTQQAFARVRECVVGIESRGKTGSEASQFQGDLAVTTESLRSLIVPEQQNAQFTWARAWYQDIGINEANPAVLAHLATQWMDFYKLTQGALQQFDPQVEERRGSVGPSASGQETGGTLAPDARELACMRLVSEMSIDTFQNRLDEYNTRPSRGLAWIALHPLAHLRQRQAVQKDKDWLTERIAELRAEAPPVAPKSKTLNALWDSCGLRDVAISLDDGAVLVSKWVGILYGDEIERQLGVVPRAHRIAAEQEEEAVAADREGYHWDFAPPIESLLYQLSKELPEYRASV